MVVYIGKRKDYTSSDLLRKAYILQYRKHITRNDILKKENGKPYFRNPDMPCFNISHSGDYVACVFDEKEIGLDIQRIRKIPEKVARRFLKTESTDPVDQIIEWTRFESYGKMKGTGIPPQDEYDKGIFLTTLKLEGYVVTICFESENNQAIKLVHI